MDRPAVRTRTTTREDLSDPPARTVTAASWGRLLLTVLGLAMSLLSGCTTVRRETPDWRLKGVRIVHGDELDMNTPQTKGMTRAAAISHAMTGAEKLWAGTVTINARTVSGAHHHGELESVIYVVSGRARMRWGETLEFTAVAGPGDFIYVPPYVPHQEVNESPSEPLSCVIVRSGQEPVVVNLDIEAAERPEEVHWESSFHPKP